MDELVELVKNRLIEADSRDAPTLVNFFDDEIFWDRIARLAVDVIMSELKET